MHQVFYWFIFVLIVINWMVNKMEKDNYRFYCIRFHIFITPIELKMSKTCEICVDLYDYKTEKFVVTDGE